MARRYGVPCAGYAGATNAKLVDAQAGFETGMNSQAALLAGVDILHMGGLLDALMALDFGKLLIDNEIAGMLKRMWLGFEDGRDELAVEVMAEVGQGGAFIDVEHTIQRMRTTAFLPQIANRSRRDVWEAGGGLDAHARASQLVRNLLKHDSPGLISPDLDAQIREEFVGIVSGDMSLKSVAS